MDKQHVAQHVADKLFATEESLDQAMIRAAQLIEAMIEGRRAFGLSAVAGEVAQSRAAEAIAALAEARRSVMATHAALANVQGKLDLQITGALDKAPGGGATGQADLRVAS